MTEKNISRRDFLASFIGAGIGLASGQYPEQNEDKQDKTEQSKKWIEMEKQIKRHEKFFEALGEIIDYNAGAYNRNREEVSKRLGKIERTIFNNTAVQYRKSTMAN